MDNSSKKHKQEVAIQKVLAVLEREGVETELKSFDQSTHSAQQAADAIGCDLGQIVKSLVFVHADTGETLLLLVSGRNRVDLDRFHNQTGISLQKADAEQVKKHTGYQIGAVPPFAHSSDLRTFIDQSILEYDLVWTAAGTSSSVLSIKPRLLVDITRGQVISVV